MTRRIGIDFGTTNSVVVWRDSDAGPDAPGHTQTYAVGDALLDTFRTVLCFWMDDGLRQAAGPHAVAAYLDDPLDSRLIMSMKTYLAQKSFTQTNIFGRVFTLEQLVAGFLTEVLKDQPKDARITAGRPVRFAGERADDVLGEQRLRAAFALAGWPDIDVAFEPEAAGARFLNTLDRPATVLIGDFGGGTSDFSILRFNPDGAPRVAPLAHTGIGIAGDSLDARIIEHVVAPLLGKNDHYKVMGQEMPIPAQYFSGFARWHQLSLMRAPRTLREIEQVAATASHPERLRHLIRLVEDEAGYAMYQAVSGVKAALSRQETATLRFAHDDFTLEREIARTEFEAWIAPELTRLDATIGRALDEAGLQDRDIDRVFLTGGTSFVPAVRALFERRFSAGRISGGGEFMSVADGLSLIGADRPRDTPPSPVHATTDVPGRHPYADATSLKS